MFYEIQLGIVYMLYYYKYIWNNNFYSVLFFFDMNYSFQGKIQYSFGFKVYYYIGNIVCLFCCIYWFCRIWNMLYYKIYL